MTEEEKRKLEEERRRLIEEALQAIAEQLPPVVFRNWKKWGDVIPISPRTLANLDSLKQGIEARIILGNVTGYPKNAMLAFLRKRMKTV